MSSLEEMNAFINALQLCIKSEIGSFQDDGSLGYVLSFKSKALHDTNLSKLEKLIPGKWDINHRDYHIDAIQISATVWPLLTSFLMISRLNDDNIMTLAEMDPRYRGYSSKFGLERADQQKREVLSVEDAARMIFERIQQNKMTLREVSQKSGMTQAALSNFKSGRDIRLSSLLKIANAVDIQLYISSSHPR